MQATLIFNEGAGFNTGPSAEELLEALGQAGFNPVYKATQTEADLDPILEEAEGLIVSAGGDGTARAIMIRLIGRDNPLAIVPLGTANNIAAALGITGSPLEIIAGLKTPRLFGFDIGQVCSPWGTDYFLEGAGFGFFADVLTTYDPEQGKSVWRGLQALTNTLRDGYVHESRLKLDDLEMPGNYVLMEALNTPAIGPRLKFAPDAHPGDGWLDVICIKESDREGLLQYAASLLTQDLDKLQTVTVCKVKELTFTWDGFPVHMDAELRPPDAWKNGASQESAGGTPSRGPEMESGTLTVNLMPQAVTLWLPPEAETTANES